MGIITFAFGMGGAVANFAALLHMTVHSLTKSAIFFAVGNATQAAGTQVIDDIRGLITTSPVVGWGLILGTLAILGMPPFGVFTSEFMMLTTAMHEHSWATPFLLVALGVAFASIFGKVQPMVFGETTALRLPHPPALIPVHSPGDRAHAGLYIPPYLVDWYRQAVSSSDERGADPCRNRAHPSTRCQRGKRRSTRTRGALDAKPRTAAAGGSLRSGEGRAGPRQRLQCPGARRPPRGAGVPRIARARRPPRTRTWICSPGRSDPARDVRPVGRSRRLRRRGRTRCAQMAATAPGRARNPAAAGLARASAAATPTTTCPSAPRAKACTTRSGQCTPSSSPGAFPTVGEKVLRLAERLGYKHKGIEKRRVDGALEGARLAGRVSGDNRRNACLRDGARRAERHSPQRYSSCGRRCSSASVANHLGD
jgi:hypothetical protein